MQFLRQQGLWGAFREREIDGGSDQRVKKNKGALLCFGRHARGEGSGHCSAQAAGRTCIALSAGVMVRGRLLAWLGIVGRQTGAGSVQMIGVPGQQHCLVIVGRRRRLLRPRRSGCRLDRRAQQGGCRSVALERHDQQHAPYEKGFEQDFHEGDFSTRQNEALKSATVAGRRRFARQSHYCRISTR